MQCFFLLSVSCFALCISQTVSISAKIALLIIDVQNCFMPEEPLGAPHGDTVAPVINQVREDYRDYFAMVVLVKDWHCPNDVAFASQYSGKNPFDEVTLHYNRKGKLCRSGNVTHSYAGRCRKVKYNVQQILWPDHCIANTNGSEFVSELITRETDIHMSKGDLCQLDTYSAFQYKGGFVETGLHEILREHQIEVVFLTGLVLEYSIYFSAVDAIKRNYSTYLVIDAIGSTDYWKTGPALYDLTEKGVKVIESGDLDIIFENLFNATSSTTSPRQQSHHSLWMLGVVTMGCISVFHWITTCMIH